MQQSKKVSARQAAAGSHAVVIAGSGPTGMMLAGELVLAGVDVAIVERRTGPNLVGSRAGGLHARTIEVMDQRGIAERFLARGKVMQVNGFGGTALDISDLPTRHNYGLALWQVHSEQILAAWIEELGVPVYRECALTSFTQDEDGVDIELADGGRLRADYLVGCDGGRSLVRKAAGIDFPGWDPTVSHLIAEVEMTEEPEWGLRHDTLGTHVITRLDDGEPLRVLVTERSCDLKTEPSLDDLRACLITAYGSDFGVHSPRWISRFTDVTRQAAAYRKGRVLLAGDAAHIHYPAGGQGLHLGVLDAVNLGWKLATVIKGQMPDSLLDSYQAERHPVAARVLRTTMAQVAVLRYTDERTKALREAIAELLSMEGPRRRFGAMMAGLDIRYDFGEGHPLLGCRMPDLDLVTDKGPLRVFSLLRRARPVLLDLGVPSGLDIAAWADRVPKIEARYHGPWELPALGPVPAPNAVLVRPDGHVAWVGEGSEAGLAEALTTWFGPPRRV
ncbi:FAD-dependent monooxygenase [Labrys neptuniae]